jgi:hypothetical protein
MFRNTQVYTMNEKLIGRLKGEYLRHLKNIKQTLTPLTVFCYAKLRLCDEKLVLFLCCMFDWVSAVGELKHGVERLEQVVDALLDFCVCLYS